MTSKFKLRVCGFFFKPVFGAFFVIFCAFFVRAYGATKTCKNLLENTRETNRGEIHETTNDRAEEFAAQAASIGLHDSAPQAPGVTRKNVNDHFKYYGVRGGEITDQKILDRINQLRIPPVYQDVWISADPLSRLQATGIDDRGRKHYYYHPLWLGYRSQLKFAHLIDFGEQLPTLRAHLARDFKSKNLELAKVVAGVIMLIDKTQIRVGNETYAEENSSYGMTTLQKSHVLVENDVIHFAFFGKSHKYHEINLKDGPLSDFITELERLSGKNLFQSVDTAGHPHPVTSSAVNEYLKTVSGGDFSAKNFRTWWGTVYAAEFLYAAGEPRDASHLTVATDAAADFAAAHLRNTRAVCLKNYIDPDIFAVYSHDWKAFSQAFSGASSEAATLRILKISHAQ